jgi:hypothetical protein
MFTSRLVIFLLATAAVAIVPSAATPHDGNTFRAFGTPVINGSFGVGEWDRAGRVQFNVARSPAQGGGVVPATLYVMNDAQNVYIGLRVANASLGESTLSVRFDGNHDNNWAQEGEDALYIDGNGLFRDRFIHQVSPNVWQSVDDDDFGGTMEGSSADGDDAGFATFEVAHPLDTTDNAHDVSLGPVVRIGVTVLFTHCANLSCGSTTTGPFSDLVVVSGSTVPPDTQITSGPGEGVATRGPDPRFEFTGTDDAISSSALTFECRLDNEPWTACTSPFTSSVSDGRHTFAVRATDEMLLADTTPAQRSWTVDTAGPSKPVIRGPRAVPGGKRLVLRFSAKDALAGGVRYRCAVDSRRLKPCPAVFRVKLRPGRHVVRLKALDRLGNVSALSTARIRVKRARR